MSFSITLRDGRCLDYARPAVMGIINLTPDSFYAASRALADNTTPELDAEALRQRVRQMLADGAQMLDVGACSTRPGYTPPTADEELRRLPQLIADFPDCPMLVGISRKSMIFKLLANDPDHALNGTTVLNTLAIEAGAHILRVHDVREAVEAVKICEAVRGEE